MEKRYIHRIGIWGIAWLVLLVAAGCSRELPVAGETLVVVADIARSEEATPTKADTDAHIADYDKQAFEAGDQISIAKADVSPATTYEKKVSGWIPVSGATPIQVAADNEIFKASYPTSFNGVLTDQTSYTKFWQSNCLKAEATATGNRVAFTFAPAACKITVEVTYTGTRTPVSAQFSGTGVSDDDAGKSGEVSLLCLTAKTTAVQTHIYTGIIKPVTGTYTISIVSDDSGNKTGTYQGVSKTFEAGHHYIYKFSSTTELILNSVTVESFTTAGSGSLDAS